MKLKIAVALVVLRSQRPFESIYQTIYRVINLISYTRSLVEERIYLIGRLNYAIDVYPKSIQPSSEIIKFLANSTSFEQNSAQFLVNSLLNGDIEKISDDDAGLAVKILSLTNIDLSGIDLKYKAYQSDSYKTKLLAAFLAKKTGQNFSIFEAPKVKSTQKTTEPKTFGFVKPVKSFPPYRSPAPASYSPYPKVTAHGFRMQPYKDGLSIPIINPTLDRLKPLVSPERPVTSYMARRLASRGEYLRSAYEHVMEVSYTLRRYHTAIDRQESPLNYLTAFKALKRQHAPSIVINKADREVNEVNEVCDAMYDLNRPPIGRPIRINCIDREHETKKELYDLVYDVALKRQKPKVGPCVDYVGAGDPVAYNDMMHEFGLI